MVYVFRRVNLHIFLLIFRVVKVEAYYFFNPCLKVRQDMSTVHVLIAREMDFVGFLVIYECTIGVSPALLIKVIKFRLKSVTVRKQT
jgi:hypothetical protein